MLTLDERATGVSDLADATADTIVIGDFATSGGSRLGASYCTSQKTWVAATRSYMDYLTTLSTARLTFKGGRLRPSDCDRQCYGDHRW